MTERFTIYSFANMYIYRLSDSRTSKIYIIPLFVEKRCQANSRVRSSLNKIICFPPVRPVDTVISARTRAVPRQIRHPNHPRRSPFRHPRRRRVLAVRSCDTHRTFNNRRISRAGRPWHPRRPRRSRISSIPRFRVSVKKTSLGR